MPVSHGCTFSATSSLLRSLFYVVTYCASYVDSLDRVSFGIFNTTRYRATTIAHPTFPSYSQFTCFSLPSHHLLNMLRESSVSSRNDVRRTSFKRVEFPQKCVHTVKITDEMQDKFSCSRNEFQLQKKKKKKLSQFSLKAI